MIILEFSIFKLNLKVLQLQQSNAKSVNTADIQNLRLQISFV